MFFKNAIFLVFLNVLYISSMAQNHNATQKYISKVWVADNGNGTYKNPVLNADYSDPDAIRVGDDFYLVSSSFEDMPGLPILHSKDLVNWIIIGHALMRQPPFDHFDVPRMEMEFGRHLSVIITANFTFIILILILEFTLSKQKMPKAHGVSRFWLKVVKD